ncbi:MULTISPECIES: hypothetical protein [unclassified Nostoc]|nr:MULTISPECIES: hypothetical protein [unclassified Nostoc]MDM9581849.1 hypothetical protein [Nostoc sp. GT001]MDZ7946459.1 hypothetical protein [Nostoc sp. EfeVER01]MDZ7994767.1 hypothetical protein [Nostoc sp. EspVER01]
MRSPITKLNLNGEWEAIATTGRRVIFYEQLGCGNSDRPTDPNLYSID